ncbi:hypothetical protein AMECASPLE_006122 [Ameca splendens]|uniref:Uncharacterized protein n=1 Tax=Ameca splendens TaxID=208324 RepID=A0ABV0YXJ4_9TELE
MIHPEYHRTTMAGAGQTESCGGGLKSWKPFMAIDLFVMLPKNKFILTLLVCRWSLMFMLLGPTVSFMDVFT